MFWDYETRYLHNFAEQTRLSIQIIIVFCRRLLVPARFDLWRAYLNLLQRPLWIHQRFEQR